MKRIGIILLLLLYLIPAVGFTVSTHYCQGKITSVSLNPFDKQKCPCGNKAMKKDCCKKTSKTFKLKAEQEKSHSFSLDFLKITSLQAALPENTALYCLDSSPELPHNYCVRPPDDVKVALYVQHCVFRI